MKSSPTPWGFHRLLLKIQKWFWSKRLERSREITQIYSEKLLVVRAALGEIEVEKIENDLARLSQAFKNMSPPWDGQTRPFLN
jgi:hypothetical protein